MLEKNNKVKILRKSHTSKGEAKGSDWVHSHYPNSSGYVVELGSDWVKVAKSRNGDGNYFAYSDLEKTNTMLEGVSSLFRRMVDKDIKTLVEAGYLTTSLELTNKGKDAMFSILFDGAKAELVKLAKEELESEDDE